MKTSDLIILSFRNLWRRKLRTFLTVLGVVIGASSIVIMLSLGLAMNKNMMAQLDKMGSLNIINVSKQWSYGNSNDKAKEITDAAVEEMAAIPGVKGASPVLNVQMKMVSGRYQSMPSIRGVDLEILKAQGAEIDWGRFPDGTDRYGFVFGDSVAYDFYNPNSRSDYGYYYYDDGERPAAKVDIKEDPIKMSYDASYGNNGQKVAKGARPMPVTVTGKLKGGSWEFDRSIYTDLATAKALKKDKEKWEREQSTDKPKTKKSKEPTYEQALIYVEDMDDVKGVQDKIKAMGYEAYSMADNLKEIQNISGGIQMVLGGIGAVSLFVAALGITNTMIMSIYERTKEIGVMKVIGASLPDIKKMFLTEAAMIGFIGGILGLLFSAGISAVLNYVGGNMDFLGGGVGGGETVLSVIPAWLYLSAILFTSMVGLLSGYFPARRAMRLSVLGALRNE